MPQERTGLNTAEGGVAKLRGTQNAGGMDFSPLSLDQSASVGTPVMKVKIEIDCTPIEARDFLGLPDVKPMQEAMMDQMQAKMQENIQSFSPEAMMRSWFSFDPKIAERFQDMFMNMSGLGGRKDK
jgi:hypothetical protein